MYLLSSLLVKESVNVWWRFWLEYSVSRFESVYGAAKTEEDVVVNWYLTVYSIFLEKM